MLTGHERFIAKYNVSLATRFCGKYSQAQVEIEGALQIVEQRNVSR